MEELPEVDMAFVEDVGLPCSQAADDGRPLPCEVHRTGSCRGLS